MSLKDIFQQHPERRYIMFGGKGGLGKTTFSAATAYWLASQGKKVLVFSVDPQASLSDIFQQDIFGKGPVKIMDNLWAQEIDADQHIRQYQQEIRQKILDMYGFEQIPDEVEQYIQAASAEPAMEESAIFDAVVDIVVEGSYDYYIYDLVPLGHALYYLSMAKVYDEWINKITKLREEMREYEEMVSRLKREKETEEDQILKELQFIRTRINASSRILTDSEQTAF
jgi:arsenite-transporting ATPase